MIYLDSSALVKLIKPEAETPALRALLTARRTERRVSSALIRTEVVRAVLGAGAIAVAEARRTLDSIDQVPLSPQLLDDAGCLEHGLLRTLDAIHLASALRLGPALSAFVAYDKRLTDSAAAAGLPVASPR